jgi:hypothetical protein
MYPHAEHMAMVGQEFNPYMPCEPLFLQPLYEWGDHAHVISENAVGSGGNKYPHPSHAAAWKRGPTIQPYCPGQMLSESANGHAFNGSSHAATSDNLDHDGESDCSTTDTANDAMTAMSSIHASLTDAPRLSESSTVMLPNAGVLPEMPWLDYSAANWELDLAPPLNDQAAYWMPPMPSMQTQGNQGILSAGSAGHNKGCCKPCAFLYKEGGCMSGALCKYCHLCPPGEKQRRKRQMRYMQKSLGYGTPNLKA